MGLSWQQGPLAARSVGQFLTAAPLPERLLFAEPLRRRMRVQLNGEWIADSEDVVLLHEPGRYPVAYFPLDSVKAGALTRTERVTAHHELGDTSWFTATSGDQTVQRAAWEFTGLPEHARILGGRIAFAWRAMDAFYEEDERILGHAADMYHRIDIRSTSRHLVVKHDGATIVDTHAPVVLYESGFAPRWYVDRADVDESALTAADGQTFCPYKGLAGYFDIGEAKKAAWGYPEAYKEVGRVRGLLSFEPDVVEVYLDGVRQHLAEGQQVSPHGVDRGLDASEVDTRRRIRA